MKLIMCVGIQGAGKSTWARKFAKENPEILYLSTDTTRKELTGSESDQSVNHLIFPTLKSKTENALKKGQSVLVDATFIKKSWRKDFVDVGKKLGAEVVAHVFRSDRDTVIKRVQDRAKNGGLDVPVDVIDKYIKQFESPTRDEFDTIIIHNS